MTAKLSKVRVVGAGPIVIGQAGSCRFVHNPTGALDLSQEGGGATSLVFAGRVGERFQAMIALVGDLREESDALKRFQALEVGRDDYQVHVAPAVWQAAGVGTEEDNLLDPNTLCFQLGDEVVNNGQDFLFCRNHVKAPSLFDKQSRAKARVKRTRPTGYRASRACRLSSSRKAPCSNVGAKFASSAKRTRSWLRGGVAPVRSATHPFKNLSRARWQKNTAYWYRLAWNSTWAVFRSPSTCLNQCCAVASIASPSYACPRWASTKGVHARQAL